MMNHEVMMLESGFPETDCKNHCVQYSLLMMPLFFCKVMMGKYLSGQHHGPLGIIRDHFNGICWLY